MPRCAASGRLICLYLLLLLSASPGAANADVRLPTFFSNHMVLQRDMPLPIWGWADPGENLTITLASQSTTTTAASNGRWMTKLPALPAGGPHELTVRGGNTVKLSDVLVGEVWLCSGQSNMEMGVGVVMNAPEEIAAARYPEIRFLAVPRHPAGEPVDNIQATWQVCSPKSVAADRWGGFSAVGYFFGRDLHRELQVPIGLIDSCWGGTRIGPWTPPGGFENVPKLQHILGEIEDQSHQYRGQQLPARLKAIEAWIAATRTALEENAPLPPSPVWPGHPLASEHQPTGLYNGMIHPLAPFAIRGAIWYQGEANVFENDGVLYRDRMKALIAGWRRTWNQGDFPFYYVQLAPFNYQRYNAKITPYHLAEIWDAQRAALEIPGTGMAATIDIGDRNDIHPQNKQEVGRRLALWALARTYGRADLVCSGPLFRTAELKGQNVHVQFDHVGGGLTTGDGQPPNWFEIAGADGKFVPGQARIQGEQVVVWHDDVPTPAALRYAWHMVPDPPPNLVNKEGLPASPFQVQLPVAP